jgi:hypothetical protein
MNDNFKLVLLSGENLITEGESTSFTTSIEGNKVFLKGERTFVIEGEGPKHLEIDREFELNDEEVAKVVEIINNLIANKEKNAEHNNEQVMDTTFDIIGVMNETSFVFKNNSDLFEQISEMINEILNSKEEEVVEDINEELEKLVIENKVLSGVNIDKFEMEIVNSSDIETEEEARARISKVLGIPEEEVPIEYITMVTQGIDNFGPIDDIVFDAPRKPRKFTDEEIKQYATEDRLNKYKINENEMPIQKEETIETNSEITPSVVLPAGMNEEALEVLKVKYPSFFDENGNLKPNAVELIDFLIENYGNQKTVEEKKL